MTTDTNWWERAALLRAAATRLEGAAENIKNEAEILRTTAAKCQQEAERVAALQELAAHRSA